MRVLGIDPSATATGWVFLSTDPTSFSGKELKFGELNPKKLTGLERVSWYYDEMDALMKEHHPELVLIEGYGYGNAYTLATLVAVGTALRLSGFRSKYRALWMEASPGTLKKFVTGSGVAKKNTMLLEVYKRWGFDAPTDNIADAYALARLGEAYLLKDPKAAGLPKFQIDSLSKVRGLV